MKVTWVHAVRVFSSVQSSARLDDREVTRFVGLVVESKPPKLGDARGAFGAERGEAFLGLTT